MKIFNEPTNRIKSVDMLRGIAALAVTIFHFTSGLHQTFWLRKIGSYGWVGVEVFFIISGFVIPLALYNSKYTYRDSSLFLLKRLTRIEPPYIICLILIVFLNILSTLSPYYHGNGFEINFSNLVLHLGYLVSFTNQPWLNPVFWTLAIEFQFYILVALIFPLIITPNKYIKALALITFLLSSFLVKDGRFIFHYSSFFALGLILFYAKSGIINQAQWFSFSLIILGVIYYQFSTIPFIASTLSWLWITYIKHWQSKWLLFLGTISYSLYLIHVPIGGRIINLSTNFVKTDGGNLLIQLFTLLITIILSFVFYNFVELPSLKLTKKIKKR